VHALRGRMDAVLVGIGTVLADNPRLTVRPPGPRTPSRIVLDSHARLPPASLLAATALTVPVLVVTLGGVPAERAAALQNLGCEVIAVPEQDGKASVPALLDELGRRRMTNLLVEGGAAVLGSFLDAGEVDEVHVFIAPRLLGGADAKTPISGRGAALIADALTLADWCWEAVEGDLLLHGFRR
jgi:diaminohydroxyphosphoribosylaminopyrimidine deaminase/5-amino-6-(5-phosphoribosylamino)uracil reductase